MITLNDKKQIEETAAAMVDLEEGSEEQIAAEVKFFAALERILPAKNYEKFEAWCFRATKDEIAEEGRQFARMNDGTITTL